MALFDFIGNALGGGPQSDYIAMLQRRALGQAPSAAQNLLKEQTQGNAMQAAGAVGGIRGINPGLRARMILDQQGRIQQQAAAQGAGLQAQEQAQATGQLGQAIDNQRQQDVGLFSGLVGGAANGVGGALARPFGAAAPNPVDVLNGIGRAKGGEIPGQAPAPGDSPQNDTVPAMLSPGEVVLPRSVAQSEDAPEDAADFVAALKGRHSGAGSQSGAGFGKVLQIQKQILDMQKQIGVMLKKATG